ncbi:MAG TPA: hypothetical protein VFI84_01090 [Candidatus Saccharimonadales bacterium]|nr:hypothetical protein [Candidatus Saccharimonadales bacterium]
MSEATLFPPDSSLPESLVATPSQRTPEDVEVIPTLLPSVSIEDMPAYKSHLEATATLHPYLGGAVVRRETLKDREDTDYARIYEEKVTFADGAIRTLTLAMPKESYFGENISQTPISSTDAWMTGPSGFNATIIRQLAERGFPVVWLHHQGRHSEKPTSPQKARQLAKFIMKKSVGRSAHHQHGLLNDLSPFVGYDSREIISIGDSRGAMTGEAVDALADMYGRTITWSDYIGGCFEHRPKLKELPAIATTLPKEATALKRLIERRKAEANGISNETLEYFGTFDLHFMNLLHEAAWFVPLVNGDSGRFADAVPLDRNGARTYMNGDIWSSRGRSWESKHSVRPGIYFFQETLGDGSMARHLDLADTYIQNKRFARLERLLVELRDNSFLSSAVDFKFVATGTRS